MYCSQMTSYKQRHTTMNDYLSFFSVVYLFIYEKLNDSEKNSTTTCSAVSRQILFSFALTHLYVPTAILTYVK